MNKHCEALLAAIAAIGTVFAVVAHLSDRGMSVTAQSSAVQERPASASAGMPSQDLLRRVGVALSGTAIPDKGDSK